MNREQVGLLLQKIYSGGNDIRVRFSAAPQPFIQELAKSLNLHWNDDDVALSAAVLTHPANLRTIDLLEDLRRASIEIDDVRALSASASLQIMWMESGIVMTGLAILAGALIASLSDHVVTAATLGGFSVASFLTLFIFDPLKQIQRSVSDSVQIELIYQAHLTELRHWKAYESQTDVTVKSAVLAEIRDSTAIALWLPSAMWRIGQTPICQRRLQC